MKKKNIFLGLILLICLTFGLIFSNNVTTVFALENNAPKDSTNIVQTENKSVNNTRSQNNVNKEYLQENQTNTNENKSVKNVEIENSNKIQTNKDTAENKNKQNETNTNNTQTNNNNLKTQNDTNTLNNDKINNKNEKTNNNLNTNTNNNSQTKKENIQNQTTNNTTQNKQNNTTITDKNINNNTNYNTNTNNDITNENVTKNKTNYNTNNQKTLRNTTDITNKESGTINENTTNNNTSLHKDCKCKIIVTGNGKVYVKPDTATIKFAVNTLGENTENLESENTQIVNNVISKLETLNINKNDIKSVSYSMFKRYDYASGEQVFLGYEISNNLEITTKNLDNITSIISTLNENGVNEIYSVEFNIEDNTEAYNNALKNALENAKTKAQVLSENKDISVCKVIECKENHFNIETIKYDAKTLNNDNFNNIMQNEICISTNIIVEFCA